MRLGVTGEPPCLNLPAAPGEYVLTAWERTTYPELIPLVDRLNLALVPLRQSIQTWTDQCRGYTTTPGYVMPPDAGITGYNLMLQARAEMNAVRELLNAVYASGGIVVPAPTSTPDPTIQAILHAPYTPTFTLTPTPSFRYTVSGATRAASAYHPGCAWYGIAGEVRNADGSPRPATLLHVTGPGYFDLRLLSGSDTRYGAAGFEVQLPADAAPSNTYTIRIEDGFGNPLSPDQPVPFSGDCALERGDRDLHGLLEGGRPTGQAKSIHHRGHGGHRERRRKSLLPCVLCALCGEMFYSEAASASSSASMASRAAVSSRST